MPVSSGEPNRVAVLDGIRGAAILLVLLVHCFPVIPQSAVAILFRHITGVAWIGVDLFFVLSGYLITGILLRTRDQPGFFRNFYARRALRILPAYYLVLAAVYLVAGPAGAFLYDDAGGDRMLEFLPLFITHLQNWIPVLYQDYGIWVGANHFWSLAIEEQFYLIWPLLVWASPIHQLRRICVLLLALALMSKGVLVLAHASWVDIYSATITRFDGLALGGFIATLSVEGTRPYSRLMKAAGLAGVAVLLGLIWVGATVYSLKAVVLGTSAATFAFGWLIFAVHSGRLAKPLHKLLQAAWLVWLGRYSYGIYLLHYVLYWPILGMFTTRENLLLYLQSLPATLMVGGITIAVTLVLARGMYWLVEAPALSLRPLFRVPAQQPV